MRRKKSKAKRGGAIALVSLVTLVAIGGGAFTYLNSQHIPRISPGTMVGDLSVGELTESEAREKLEKWWGQTSNRPVQLSAKGLTRQPESRTAAELGAQFDVEATLDKLPYDDFVSTVRRRFQGDKSEEGPKVVAVVTFTEGAMADIKKFVASSLPPKREARVQLEGGTIIRTTEQAGVELDEKGFAELAGRALAGETNLELPLIEAKKRIPDAELEKIRESMSEFSTTFSEGKVARSANIKLAAERLNGLILMPGEKFSFNGTLGQRTTAKGYKVAGVYVSGRHDFDVGGGICQVSTTLYNAALMADLKIGTRSPHSLPVPYVPLGRDAAVSFPNPDLQIVNNQNFPIAIASRYEPGRLHFSILGQNQGIEVKFEQRNATSWGTGEKIVHDGTLAYGVRKVVDRGGSGRKIETIRIVYKDGKEIERQSLGNSVYRGGPRIIAVNKNAKPPVAAPPTAPTVPKTEPPATVPVSAPN